MSIKPLDDPDFFVRFDYSNLIAKCAVEMYCAGLTWRSPEVVRWMGEVGPAKRDYLDVDGFYWLLERLAIYLIDGEIDIDA